jgi:hypothetical protein
MARLMLGLLDRGKNIYNLALTECKKRLHKIRADKEYQRLLSGRRALRRSGKKTEDIDKSLNDIVKVRYKLTGTDIEKYVKDNADYLPDGFNSQFAQNLADRAFDTISKILLRQIPEVQVQGQVRQHPGVPELEIHCNGAVL